MARLCPNLHDSLTDDVLQALFAKKCFNITDFLSLEVKLVTKVTNLTYKEVLNIRTAILNAHSAKILNGLTYYSYLLQNTTLTPTNIKNFDNLIDGGLLSGNIYELCGYSATGKSQICFSTALNISQNFSKFVYYIDTKRDFCAKKLQNILEARKCNEEISGQILDRIKVKEISDQYQLLAALFDIKTELVNGLNCPLIIIDSLPAVFYNLSDFNYTLSIINNFVNIMRFLSVEYQIAFIVTNIMIKESNDGENEIIKPGLGTYWSNIPNTRIICTKNGLKFRMTIAKSSCIKCNKNTEFSISDLGVN